jgi:hypothetical protein
MILKSNFRELKSGNEACLGLERESWSYVICDPCVVIPSTQEAEAGGSQV